jgi:hypothetical protein
VTDKYYYARHPTPNRIVDITGTVEKKIDANICNVAKGPGGHHGSKLRAELAKQGQVRRQERLADVKARVVALLDEDDFVPEAVQERGDGRAGGPAADYEYVAILDVILLRGGFHVLRVRYGQGRRPGAGATVPDPR